MSRYVVTAIILALFFSCCSPVGNNRHQPSGINSGFSFTGKSFNEYIAYSSEIIEKGRVDLINKTRDAIIEGNSPFTLAPANSCGPGKEHPYKRGILLAHGLTDSPYTMKSLGNFFKNECFFVAAILLPGHGTRPGDLLDVTWEEWDRAFSFGVETLKEKADSVYLGGFSTGGTLAIYHSMMDMSIKGLFLFSPAVRIDPKARYACELSSLRSIIPYLGWIGKLQPDGDPFKYESFTSNAACQVFRLTKEIEGALTTSPVTIPLFMAASADDFTVKSEATLELFGRATSQAKKMLLYARGGVEAPKGVEVIESRIPEKKILSSSHMAIVLPPKDPYYGENGMNSYCVQYYGRNEKAYERCVAKDEDYLGEISGEFLRKGVVRRLTWNPHYEELLGRMQEFIKGLP